ncbi:MAG: hypothetical protein U0Q18_36940 [Bryobacteraceae bacterium]
MYPRWVKYWAAGAGVGVFVGLLVRNLQQLEWEDAAGPQGGNQPEPAVEVIPVPDPVITATPPVAKPVPELPKEGVTPAPPTVISVPAAAAPAAVEPAGFRIAVHSWTDFLIGAVLVPASLAAAAYLAFHRHFLWAAATGIVTVFGLLALLEGLDPKSANLVRDPPVTLFSGSTESGSKEAVSPGSE